MKSKNSHSTSQHPPRKTMALQATVSGQEAKLDHVSALAVAYGQAWIQGAYSHPTRGGRKPPGSGVVRRALALYMDHLGALTGTEEKATEYFAMEDACKSSPVDRSTQEEAYRRLSAANEGCQLPTYTEVLRGAYAVKEAAGFDDRFEALMLQVRPGRRRIKSGPASAKESNGV